MASAAPTASHSAFLRGSSAGVLLLYGSDRPSASMAQPMVLAVYMPPHAPDPGHALCTIAERVSSVMRPATNSP